MPPYYAALIECALGYAGAWLGVCYSASILRCHKRITYDEENKTLICLGV